MIVRQFCWLEPGRTVVEQVPGTDLDIIILHFGIMVYHENFKQLQDGVAIGLYYIQCQQLIYKNIIQCEHPTLIKLTALVLQAQLGDYTT
ncbi:FERM domain-containing protein 4A-like [Oopsacas minuta]|uniref:FERM domain-containing protein 4A-like n=1 Tax=Oopsacas minuta TaxID=111878 RepID=A0AAV7JZC3_9METZ|nr:FERM domain-containing protein 4A-like [Oopsacas minuta]